MEPHSHNFKKNAARAAGDEQLKQALARAQDGFVGKRAIAVDDLPEFEALREQGKTIRNHVLANLDYYLERYEAAVQKQGGVVHWAETSADAQNIVRDICKRVDAKLVIKGKSMISEEVALNEALEGDGLEVVESDLGEYILQLAKEPPSHIIAPAIHKSKAQISELFYNAHKKLGFNKKLDTVPDLVNEARQVLRSRYLEADVGITGANFLIAETGSNIIVTNEGNGDLSCTLPRVHIVTASIEKVVPTLDDASALLRLLARSATGQEITSYTTFSTGPRRAGDTDGPEEYHVVLVDNGRTEMLAGGFREMLRCIRCGACMNHCPVYGAIGGHSYGWVYPGPMGSVLTPNFLGLKEAGDLAHACTLNGRCSSVCPMKIPLPDLLREHRRRQFEAKLAPKMASYALAGWGFLAKRPKLYQPLTALSMKMMAMVGHRKGRFRSLPMAGGWTNTRDLPAPQGETFHNAWRKRRGGK
ncbi:MAG: iron-sulfur cluster-binding protein [Sulfitobacter sp.]|nr:iron-sulfur cluster-binding protein [Sulfitobacter sp.]MCP4287073.1 iron-sulfur cluster-binding protein [Gammaproteobacteria bacterium]